MAGVAGVSGRLGQIARYQLKAPLILACRPAHYWNKDWAPKPHPRTEEEHRAAAKKYNMLPEDYKPSPENDEMSWGDYPHLPRISASARDPYEQYDFPFLRRNYGEPVDIFMDGYTLERMDTSRLRTPMWKQMVMCLGTILGLWYAVNIFEHPKLRGGFNPDLGLPQLPREGVVHYTFDPPE
ncbi:NADH:ubiquinone oxidoreductase subunit ASHI [Haemaphysalis longicornis]